MASTRKSVRSFMVRRAHLIVIVSAISAIVVYDVFVRRNASRLPTIHNDPKIVYGDGSSPDSLKDLPWHLVRIERTLIPRNAVKSIAVDVEIAEDVPSAGNLFIVPIAGQDPSYYFGAISNGDGMRKGEDLSINLGHCFVFSRWGDKDPTACRPAEGGYYLASGHEGNHVSVRLLHPWGKGRYTFTLRRESK